MCCEMYFRRAIHSSNSGRVFINKDALNPIVSPGDIEKKSEQEGDSYGN